ncbi:MAG TPA: L,D-transpeptidase family protein [Gemmatimonadaceae bacterium]|jgi:murein L,D-transpeptidase YcbB/YkuD|nr:L,D-transpeptidase family protein [Gemmatimonadaceae bacterium]
MLTGGLTACDFGREPQRSETGGEIDDSFEPTKVESVKGVPVARINAAIDKRLDEQRPKPISESQWKHAKKLYDEYGGYPIWLDDDGLRERRTKTLMTALLAGDADALALDNYPLTELHRVLSELLEAKDPSADLLADVDVALTATYVALGEDLLTGQVDPSTVSQDWHIEPTPAQVDSALGRFLRDRDFDVSVTQMRPEYDEYKALQKQLVRYRQIIARGGWQPVPEGRAVKPGGSTSAERLTALRERLRVEGYLTGDSAIADTAKGQAEYDRELAGAVAQFQREHGIVVDSALGRETLQALNVPAAYRLGQIAANMERFRWMPRTLGDKYVFVNVPAFRLEAFDDARKVMEMKVIVGAEFEDRNTPVFSDSMQYVVFRPYWNATDNIMEKELWPKVEADPTFLERNNYEIVTEGGKQRIRQLPGDGNALGLVKFMFPNTFDIYMHDTPEQSLFDRDVRAFSHGCIRLEHPEKMAEWVLGWTPEQVQEAMHSTRDNRHVNLKDKVPVYIVYFTTFIRDGRLHFGNDLYNRDAGLVERVKNGAQPTVEAVKAVKVLRELAED